MIELLKFSHNREGSFKDACVALRNIIDVFVEQEELSKWYKYFENNYSLPKDVIKHQMKQYLEGAYHYQKTKFSKKLSIKYQYKYLVKYLGFLSYVVCKSRKYTSKRAYELIVDWIETDGEIGKFTKLMDLFKNSLIINHGSATGRGYETITRPPFKFYDTRETKRVFLKEISSGLLFYLRISKKCKVNLLPLALHIVNEYCYYYSIFKYNQAKYCIQARHYQTSALKNHLFHVFDGKYSCSIQKNIHQMGKNGFYYDMDIFFSLGNKTADRVFECGSRINQVVPVGSLLMEYYWFTEKKYKYPLEKKYDVICFGGNGLGVGSIFNAYETYLQDYYEHYIWLAKLSKENPELVIGIKHHSNNKLDHREMEIIKNSNVVRIDQKLNSYEVGFQSNCCVTFASTIGYELIAHGIPTLFLDPGRRNSQFLPDNDLIDHWRVSTYEEFSVKIKNLLLEKDFGQSKTKAADLCLNSQHVSERIHAWFNSNW